MSGRPPTGQESPGRTLELLVGGGRGEAEKLLLIEPPRADGLVRVRQWTSADWGALPATLELRASALLSEIERAARQGRSLNRELTVVRRWLAEGQEPRAP